MESQWKQVCVGRGTMESQSLGLPAAGVRGCVTETGRGGGGARGEVLNTHLLAHDRLVSVKFLSVQSTVPTVSRKRKRWTRSFLSLPTSLLNSNPHLTDMGDAGLDALGTLTSMAQSVERSVTDTLHATHAAGRHRVAQHLCTNHMSAASVSPGTR